jgi:uncharacterized protein (DUF362 family)
MRGSAHKRKQQSNTCGLDTLDWYSSKHQSKSYLRTGSRRTTGECDILGRMGDLLHNVVAVARTGANYQPSAEADCAPEIGGAKTSAEVALHRLFRTWRLDPERYGTSAWNPLAALIPPESCIVMKPNWVFHENQSGAGLECLLTHSSIIEAVAKYVSLTDPAHLVIGDAPLQGCDFEQLRRNAGIDGVADRLRQSGLKFSIADFRRTILAGNAVDRQRSEGVRDLSNFVIFDLKNDSLLESLSKDASKFRVTMYDPELLQRTHGAGRHQYLIAREVIQANVVINLPKLKSHKKACVTGALKNLVGINGNKEYLPHHRKGGSENGGDCYPGGQAWKRATEELLDAANRRPPGSMQAAFAWMAGTVEKIAVRVGADENLEGSWYGNGTIWRTCLDLQRILRYGRLDGSLAPTPQRTVISITDAIIGGEGEGPLANTPVPSGFVTGSLNCAAAEWAHARLMGFDPVKIPLIREAFGQFSYPLTDFSPDAIRVWIAETERSAAEIRPFDGRSFLPPRGWRGQCELMEGGLTTHAESADSCLFG